MGCSSYISIRTKADVMKFALEMTAERQDNGKVKFDKKKAKDVFDFYCGHVSLPDTDVVLIPEILSPILDEVKNLVKAKN